MVNVCLNVSLLNLEVFPINQFFLSHFQNFSLESSYNLSKYVIWKLWLNLIFWINESILYLHVAIITKLFSYKNKILIFVLYHENPRLNNDEVILVWRRSWKPPKVSILTRFRHFSRHLPSLVLLWEQKIECLSKN